ncbi:MAG: ice-binding family protein [Solirubrobacteraceae bacterium]|nr:ice-binding family protein [Solirubrobacteraceae bacterium]
MIRRLVSRRAGVLCIALLMTVLTATAQAATPAVPLGSADGFAVLAGSTITNTGDSVINGDLGLHPGTAVTGFPPGTVNGAQHLTDAVAARAKADLVSAYDDAAGRPLSAASPPDIGGQTLTAGVYRTGSVPALELTGDVTLDAQGDPRAVFIFQAASSLITATDSSVTLINGAQACNVFWQVGSSATLGTRTAFKGTVMALTSISVNDGVRVDGRLLARNGAVTLINDTISRARCATGSDSDSSGGDETSDATSGEDGPSGGTGTDGTGGSTTTATGATATGTTGGATSPGAQPSGDTGGGGSVATAGGDTGDGATSGSTGGDADTGATGGGDTTDGGAGDDTDREEATARRTSAGGDDDDSAGFLADGDLPFTGLDIRFLAVGFGLVLLGIGLRFRARDHGAKR